ncbi:MULTISPECIES: glutaredoxin [Peptoniphilus]|uniref:glutaredoxin family protein n=1 Tax=Peptoniphilus TaxID=162289 RepID=UPI0001DA9ED9|nr:MULTISPECIES: glutaredoxin [Peptoniphilus]EFI41519.1 glutaredoxin [Peptoniphilus sp. oral taxon 386 str. F0131]
MENLRLFTGTWCPFCKRVEFFISKNNISDIEIINIDKDKDARDYLIEKGGMRQVPCLFIGEKPMYESRDIINYLKDRYEK